MIIDQLMHYGILRKSGRYPWGSGENPNQRNKMFLDHVEALRKEGMTEAEIANGLGMTTTQLRATKSIAKTEQKQQQMATAVALKGKGMSTVAVAEQMGLPESTVRTLLDPSAQDRRDVLNVTSSMLKDQVDAKGYIDIGAGVETQLGISGTKLNTSIAMLQEEGYTVHYVKVEQLGTGKQTTVKVLAAPDTTYSEVFKNQDKIQQIQTYSEDGGRTFNDILPPKSISSRRVGITYAEDGGANADGVIYLRRGVDDVSLGASRYAQVRIAVDGTHYIKGMAMYKDDMPPGVDVLFNTNKSNTGNKLDALKELKDDADLPFGAVIKRQQKFIDKSGKEQLSSINVVNEEGNWGAWSKSISSQMLSKQSPTLAKAQLELTFAQKKQEFDEINALTNPAIKKKLLEAYSDGVDSSAVHLKAAALPRQSTHVILPVNGLKDNEIYAPNYRNGEKVVLVRFPHGGTFEIPELTVNNRHPEAKNALGQAIDAVGINAKVAERLSGADFDGDTVLVIPNNSRQVKNSPPLEGLKNFDPKTSYPPYHGMKTMDGGTYNAKTGKTDFAPGKKPSSRTKQREMGDVSNLITDMTIREASQSELARAVRHSMVVIDAEKHKLDYKLSKQQNGISALKEKYQGGPRAGASTLISRSGNATVKVADRKPRSAKDGGPIDPVTGKKVFTPTGDSYTKDTVSKRTGETTTRVIPRLIDSKPLLETDDAFTLSSGTAMEAVYANHANRLKTLANTARKTALQIKPSPYSPSAKKAYNSQVESLNAKLNIALRNKPLERQAQIIANSVVSAKRQANPDMEAADIKKIKGRALTEARIRTGAQKQRIEITKPEWDAIQAGAISTNKLNQILDNADLDQVKKLATPRKATVTTPAVVARAKAMLSAGYTQSEIADALGIPTSTLNSALSRKD